jgi:hypothetical protein
LARPPPHFFPSLYLLHSHIALGLTAVLFINIFWQWKCFEALILCRPGRAALLDCASHIQLYGAAKSVDTLTEFVAHMIGLSDVTRYGAQRQWQTCWLCSFLFTKSNVSFFRDKWVLVTRARRVLRLRMEERPPIWSVAANIFNKQSLTADKKWSSNLGVGRCGKNSSPLKRILLGNIHTESFGPGLIFWYVLSNEKGTRDLLLGILGACIGQVHLQ